MSVLKPLILLILFFVTGCAAFEKSPNTAVADLSNNSVSFSNTEDRLSGLGPIQNAALPEKKCGMVLWTLEGTRPSAIFRFVSGEQAEINLAGQNVLLERVDFSGASGFGVYEQQTFRSHEGIEIEISARFGLDFANGAYLERGLIKLNDQEGWSMVAPTAGIAGCRT
ncbi:hypothetical protein PUV54_14915 [Hyphococcus flavus]|uniref:Lipoprotein n=1 Tax=Hyphococcus flavus TaxID=1866326 RepID=A0AAF0CBL0_9PROT|nr:hypothetical protein [Hyphococcus flavus]WDI31240.1 hypothetical protein PUV54_14915 [Hyphococcus flavus]